MGYVSVLRMDPVGKGEQMGDFSDTYEAIETARRHVFEGLRFKVYDVLESDDPTIDALPIYWTRTIDGPTELPPRDCWVVLCDADLQTEEASRCGGTVRVIFVSKASGEVVYDCEYEAE